MNMLNQVTIEGVFVKQEPRVREFNGNKSINLFLENTQEYDGSDGRKTNAYRVPVNLYGNVAQQFLDEVSVGDRLIISGQFRSNKSQRSDGGTSVYYEISAFRLAVIPAENAVPQYQQSQAQAPAAAAPAQPVQPVEQPAMQPAAPQPEPEYDPYQSR